MDENINNVNPMIMANSIAFEKQINGFKMIVEFICQQKGITVEEFLKNFIKSFSNGERA